MLDFLLISARPTKRGGVEIYPRFKICKTKDLMIKGSDFHAIWDEENQKWQKDEQDVVRLIDNELDKYAKAHKEKFDDNPQIMYMWDSDSGIINKWHTYCQKQMRDNYVPLDETLVFNNQQTTKEDYSSKRLSYSLEKGQCNAWDEIVGTLYEDSERHKIEWTIGAIVTGESKKLQKFIVMYGAPGTGKGTILNIIQMLFEGYYTVFDAASLGSSSDTFALEQFKNNPLVAICTDGDLSRIENNARINALVSHELMTVNEKHKSLYVMRFNAFLIAASNKYVQITDAKSGLIRRLIEVFPKGVKIPRERYENLMNQVQFELGHIAKKCADVYLSNPKAYDDYIPITMMQESNDFFDFIHDNSIIFTSDDGITLKSAWELYKTYCEDAKVKYPYPKRQFSNELKNYFEHFEERHKVGDDWVRSYYYGFKKKLINGNKEVINNKTENDDKTYLIDFKEQESKFDILCKDCPAQYANEGGTPMMRWASNKNTLHDLDTEKLHYVKVPENHIVIDFDLKDEQGNKSYNLNLIEASKWPKTYAELSKSGGGIHLHYIYDGDVKKINRIYNGNPNIEIKVFTGDSSLRRKLSKCNSEDINHISSGLPMKGEIKVIDFEGFKDDQHLINTIKNNLQKKYGATKPSIDYIYNALEKAYESGMTYDVSTMYDNILAFAANSTHNSDYCIKKVMQMKFKSEEKEIEIKKTEENSIDKLVFFDVEVYPNLFLVCYKFFGDKVVHRLYNPKPKDIELLCKYRLVGFNNRSYDNHIMYGCLLGYTNEQLFNLSQSIINNDNDSTCKFGNAYNLSYTDIYDYCSNDNKKSLKKWEIELGIPHKEMDLPWDQPVPKEKWEDVGLYCDNDVLATEAVWNATQDDFTAREILAEIAGMSVNDTTNSITTKIIFGNNKKPQAAFNYPDLSKEFPGYEFVKEWNGKTYTRKNMYRGVDLGLGGFVDAEPGMYGDIALIDIASMHPHSIIAMNLFGEYTKNFKDLVDVRIHIKHKEYDIAKTLFDGKLSKYLIDPSKAKKLSKALKTAINSVYGLTSASYDNAFKDKRNENNVVALRGALFMKTLEDEVKARGFKVAHIKTDSIKIPDATLDIINFCYDFAKKYGYTFEHEATYDRMTIVNDSVYIAKYKLLEDCEKLYGKDYVYSSPEVLSANKEHKPGEWTATGTQFQVPYVFKRCFSKEDIEFKDLCETKTVKSCMYLDYNEPLESDAEFILLKEIREKVKKNIDEGLDMFKGMSGKKKELYNLNIAMSDEELDKAIENCHSYQFVGKVGLFTPIKPAHNGGLLVRVGYSSDGTKKYDSVTGASGYRWMESDRVQELGYEDYIDYSYYENLVNKAIEEIQKYGDYYWFVSEDPYTGPNGPGLYNKYFVEDDSLPF